MASPQQPGHSAFDFSPKTYSFVPDVKDPSKLLRSQQRVNTAQIQRSPQPVQQFSPHVDALQQRDIVRDSSDAGRIDSGTAPIFIGDLLDDCMDPQYFELQKIKKGHSRERRKMTNKLRVQIMMRDEFRCQYCGRSSKEDGVKLHVDHIIPIAKGGKTVPENLRTLCQDCNLGKSRSTEEELAYGLE